MKLEEFLKTLDENEMVHLGTEKGSMWIAIEPAGVLLTKLDKLNKEMKRDNTNRLKNARENVKWRSTRLLYASDESEREELTHKLEVAKKYEQKYKEHLKNWVAPKDREVVNTYEHTFEVAGTSVEIDGFEYGKYWSRDEYENF